MYTSLFMLITVFDFRVFPSVNNWYVLYGRLSQAFVFLWVFTVMIFTIQGWILNSVLPSAVYKRSNGSFYLETLQRMKCEQSLQNSIPIAIAVVKEKTLTSSNSRYEIELNNVIGQSCFICHRFGR